MGKVARNMKEFSTTRARYMNLATSHPMKRVILSIALVALICAKISGISASEPSISRERQDNTKNIILKFASNQQRKVSQHDQTSTELSLPSTTPTVTTSTLGPTSSDGRDVVLVSSSTVSYINATTNNNSATTPPFTPSSESSTTTRSDRTVMTQAPYEIPSTTTESSVVASKEVGGHQQSRRSNQNKLQTFPVSSSNNRQQSLTSSADNVGQYRGAKQSGEGGDSIDQMSTSQSAAEPSMASSNTEQTVTQHQFYQKPTNPSNNRWTHFGARLRPLTGPNGLTNTQVEQQTAANSKSPMAVAYNHNGNNGMTHKQVLQAHAAATGHRDSLTTNNLDDNEDLDDDQDNEALLYKMMQQQSFLMSPSWQDQSTMRQSRGQTGQQRQQQSSVGKMFASNGGAGGDGSENEANHQNDLSNSKKVIKLLKSYSHIHQVDDSDDQIRGTNTRQTSRRPVSNAAASGWSANAPSGRAKTYNNNNNPRPNQQQQHIFVSSQPLAQAYSQPSSRQQSPINNNYDSAPSDGNQNYAGEQPDQSQGEDPNGAAPEEDEFECPNNGIFADEPSGCQSYHVCQSGAQVQQKFQCPMGTLFNNIILTCDFAHNVQCGNKPKQANPHAIAQQQPQIQENIYRQQPQQQQQQVPKASSQLIQASQHVRSQSQQYDNRQWSSQVQNQGPKPLKVGPRQPSLQSAPKQQYARPSVAQAQAAAPYPAPRPPVNGPSEDSDEDSLMPLVPATLPPRSQQSLPYNPPPAPANQQQYQQVMPRQQQQQQPFQGSQYQSNYDEASVSKPVFVSQGDELNKPKVYGDSKLATTSEDPNEFKLVINHVAPKASPSSATFADGKKLQVASESPFKPSSVVAVNQVAPKPVAKSSSIQKHQQYSPPAQRSNTNPRQTDNVRQQKQQVSRVANIGSQRQATQTRPVHVEAGSPAGSNGGTSPAKQQPTGLVDLTNDRRQTVSSEAINDGLLLIVRHPTSTGSSNQVNGQDRSRSDYNKPQVSVTVRKDAFNGAVHKHQSSGQAFAIVPTMVRPNSPIDGQLFPNVQRLLSAAHSDSSLGHQAAQSTHYVHHAAAEPFPSSRQQASQVGQQQPTNGAVNQMLRAIQLPVLPPMSPPKPAPGEESTRSCGDGIGMAGSNNLKITNQIGEQNKQRSKRAKRLKPAQPPTGEHSTRPSTTSTTTTTTTSTTTGASSSESTSRQRQQSAGDQPVTIITDFPRRSAANTALAGTSTQVTSPKRRSQ